MYTRPAAPGIRNRRRLAASGHEPPAGKGIRMKKEPPIRPVQIEYLILGGKMNVLADERDKQMLISQVDLWRQQERLSVYAFCLTNSELHLLVDGRVPLQDTANDLLFFLGECTAADPLAGQPFHLELDHADTLKTEEEMRYVCRKIHQLPVACGFSARIQDYWWSSYPSYVGIHEWKLLDKGPMLLLFGPSKAKAMRQLRRYHEIPDIIF